MRGFTRMALRLAMVIFLVVGCVENVYYFGELTKNSNYNSYNRYGNRYGNTIYEDADEIEEIEEVPSDTSQIVTYEDEYPDYNRGTSAVTRY
jgi:hypothetical protein